MEDELQKLRALAAAIVGSKRGRAQGGLQDLAADGLLRILDLKEANKRLCARVEAAREETSKAKLSLEGADLQLQNLLYEKGSYEKEILACRSFASKIKDDVVALMPEADFLTAIQSSQAAEDQELITLASQSQHEQMKARLVHEQRMRQQLVKKLDELKQQRDALQEQVSSQQKVLNDLQARLRTVETQAKPLQTVLGQTMPLKPSMSRAAELLPTALYIAYSQLTAVAQAMQIGCSISIVGSSDEAESFAKALPQEGGEEQPKPSSLDELYKPHPLSVELHVHKEAPPQANNNNNHHNSTNSASLKPPVIITTVVLQYLPHLKVVTAHCRDPQDTPLLSSLFPGDDGTSSGLEALSQLQRGTFKFSASRTSRPYRWCQHLSGLDFVLPLPQLALQLQPGEPGGGVEAVLSGLEVYRRQQRAACVVQRVRQLKLSDLSLKAMLAGVPRNPLPADMSMYPSGPPTSLVVVWEPLQQQTTAGATAQQQQQQTNGAKQSQQDVGKAVGSSSKQPIMAPSSLDAGRQNANGNNSSNGVGGTSTPVPAGVVGKGIGLSRMGAAAGGPQQQEGEEGEWDEGELPASAAPDRQPLGAQGRGGAGALADDAAGVSRAQYQDRNRQQPPSRQVIHLDEEEEEGALPDDDVTDNAAHAAVASRGQALQGGAAAAATMMDREGAGTPALLGLGSDAAMLAVSRRATEDLNPDQDMVMEEDGAFEGEAGQQGEEGEEGGGSRGGRELGGRRSVDRRGGGGGSTLTAAQLLLLEQEDGDVEEEEEENGGTGNDNAGVDVGKGVQGVSAGVAAALVAARLQRQQRKAAAALAASCRSCSRVFRVVVRGRMVELEAHVRVYNEYPARAPLLRVRGLRRLTTAAGEALVAALAGKGGVQAVKGVMGQHAAGEGLGQAGVNHSLWLEQQVNVEALSLVPKPRSHETLLYQLLHTRLCLDALSQQLEAEAAAQTRPKAGGGSGALLQLAPGSDLGGLHARQQLVGRDRQPGGPGQAAAGLLVSRAALLSR